MRVCTVINKAWLAHARALAESLHAHEPRAELSVLVVDSIEGFVDPDAEPFEILGPEQVAIADFATMSVRYDITELCCALKPAIMRHLLDGDEPVVYLDSDVRVFAPLDGLEEALHRHPFLLTPHLLSPLEDDGREPGELAILLAGTSNLGFAAARSTPEVEELLNWWFSRLREGSRLDPARGMVYDQRWTDLMPGMFDSVGRWRDPGVNAGYWRAATQPLRAGRRQRDGRRCAASHLSLHGLRPSAPGAPEQIRQPQLLRAPTGAARPVRRVRPWTGRVRPHGGQPLAVRVRRDGQRRKALRLLRDLWDRAAREGALHEPPFTASGERAFLDWLAEPAGGARGGALSRYLASLHTSDPELRERFPDAAGADLKPYLAWAKSRPSAIPARSSG